MKKILYPLVTIVLLNGCAEKSELPGSVYGVVTDKATGELINAAGVQLHTGVKTVTGSEGRYEFAELPAGDYILQITKTGYTDLLNYKITANAGQSTQGDVQIEKLPAALRIVNDNREDIDRLDFGNAVSDIMRLFNIFNDSPEPLKWKITTAAAWIVGVSETEGTLNAGKTQGIIVTIDREQLLDGKNTTTIHVTSDNGNKTITITATKGEITNDYIEIQAAGIAVQKTDIGQGNWTSVSSMCENSIVGGYTDWRLPTKDELTVLYNEKENIGGFESSTYWSSTIGTNYYGDSHYGVSFFNGNVFVVYSDNDTYYARCVRTLP